MSQMKSRGVRLAEAAFGGILGTALVLVIVGALQTPVTLASGLVLAGCGIGVGTLLQRAWRKLDK